MTSHFDPFRFNANGLINAFARIGTMNGYLTLGPQTTNDIATDIGLSDSNDTDRLLEWGEDTCPELLSPTRRLTQQAIGYTHRSDWAFVAKRGGAARVRRSFVRATILKEELT